GGVAMKNMIPALASGVIALVIGVAAGWYFASGKAPAPANTTAATPRNNAPLETPPLNVPDKGGVNTSDYELLLNEAKQRIGTLESELADLKKDKTSLESDGADLQAEILRLQDRVVELEKLAAGPNNLLVAFGKWAEIKELRETGWKEVGDAVKNMNPHLAELTKAILDGKDPPAEIMQKIQEQNRRILAEYGKIIGKLPTNSGHNGEFTHPIYFM